VVVLRYFFLTDAAWSTAVDVYAGYENYRLNCAPRQIRIFRLRPVASDRGTGSWS